MPRRWLCAPVAQIGWTRCWVHISIGQRANMDAWRATFSTGFPPSSCHTHPGWLIRNQACSWVLLEFRKCFLMWPPKSGVGDNGKEMKSRRNYDEEFKKQAVRLSYESGKSISQVAQELGVAKSALYEWRAQTQTGKNTPPPVGKTPKEVVDAKKKSPNCVSNCE